MVKKKLVFILVVLGVFQLTISNNGEKVKVGYIYIE